MMPGGRYLLRLRVPNRLPVRRVIAGGATTQRNCLDSSRLQSPHTSLTFFSGRLRTGLPVGAGMGFIPAGHDPPQAGPPSAPPQTVACAAADTPRTTPRP